MPFNGGATVNKAHVPLGYRVAALAFLASGIWYTLVAGQAPLSQPAALAAETVTATPPVRDAAMLHAPTVAWPPGAGAAIAQSKCLICHNGEIIQAQQLGPKQWTAEVAKMTKWGAPLTPAEQTTLATYLASQYNPKVTPVPPPTVHF
jgi:mono/diheme cytochrome c family protein